MNIEAYTKIHPKSCKRLSSENECRFKEECEYTYVRKNPEDEKKVLKDKVEVLENTVNELTRKLEARNLDQLEKGCSCINLESS